MESSSSRVLKAILFFELLHHPVRVVELSRLTGFSVSVVMHELQQLVLAGTVAYVQGAYVLERRADAYTHSIDRATPKAWQRIKFIRFLAACNPFIESVAVVNSLSMGTHTSTSDIDLFVITRAHRLYLARLFFVLPLKLLRLRPLETSSAPVCASFMVDADHLDISGFAVSRDALYSYWAASFMWVFDRGHTAAMFLDRNRILMKSFALHEHQELLLEKKESLRSRILATTLKIIDHSWCENSARVFELWYAPKTLTHAHAPVNGVVITPSVFKTHLKDPRMAFSERFNQVCELYGFKNS